MNRREFTKSLAAAATLPLMPLPAMAKPVAAVAPRSIDLMWGAAIARAQNSGNVDMLAKSLKVTPQVAQAVQSHLLKTNVITMGASPGATVAVKPTFAGRSVITKMADTMDRVEEILDAIPSAETPPQPDEPPADVPAK